MPRHSKDRAYGPGMADCFDDKRYYSRGFNQFRRNKQNDYAYQQKYQGYIENRNYRDGRDNMAFNSGVDSYGDYDVSFCGNFYGNRHYQNRDHYNYEMYLPSANHKGDRKGRGRGLKHPPHLKGREIGMWYAKQQKKPKHMIPDNGRDLMLSKTEFQSISRLMHLYGKDMPYSEMGRQLFSVDSELHFEESETDSDYDDIDLYCKNMVMKNEISLKHFHPEQFTRDGAGCNLNEIVLSQPPLTLKTESKFETGCNLNEIVLSQPPLTLKTEETMINSNTECESLDKVVDNIVEELEGLNEGLEIFDDKLRYDLPTTDLSIRNVELDKELKEYFLLNQKRYKYQEMLKFRKKLPVYEMQEEILSLINENQVIVLSGETGSGKTTQIPQFILDDLILNSAGSTANILTTQPRRISAISVAQRVADERAQVLGDNVGYQIRLEKILPAKGRGSILFCTTGVILQWMTRNPTLNGFSHVILDEVHERDIQTDVLITFIRDILPHRSDLKVVLMSATLNAQKFSEYFYNCPTINVPGRLFPVTTMYLEDVLDKIQMRMETSKLENLRRQNNRIIRERSGMDISKRKKQEMVALSEEKMNNWLMKISKRYSRHTLDILRAMGEYCEPPAELVAAVVDYVINNSEEGAVLVFVPGSGMIKSVIQELRKLHPRYSEKGGSCRLYPLHSMLPTLNQRDVFNVPPSGCRKVIVATNIAETSVTIEDVVYVVDSGRIKMTDFDPTLNTHSLLPILVSKANAAQRTGRAGRVRPGQCLKLFSRFHENTMSDSLTPEIMRTRLENVILQIKLLDRDHIQEFLSKCMDSPEPQSVAQSVRFLKSIQALDDEESLTPLGRHLAHLPMDPQCAKMILLGALFSCLDPILTIAATLSFKDPFYAPIESKQQADAMKMKLADGCQSDHILLIRAVEGFEEAYQNRNHREFCYKYFISESNMWQILKLKKEYARQLYDCGYIPNSNPKNSDVNTNSGNLVLIRALICGGLYPNIVEASTNLARNSEPKSLSTFKILSEPGESKVSIMPGSVTYSEKFSHNVWLTYFKKMRINDSKTSVMFDTTVLGPRPVVFFGGHLNIISDRGMAYLTVDNWIRFRIDEKVAYKIMALRGLLNTVLSDKVEVQEWERWRMNTREASILNTIVDILSVDDIRPYHH